MIMAGLNYPSANKDDNSIKGKDEWNMKFA